MKTKTLTILRQAAWTATVVAKEVQGEYNS